MRRAELCRPPPWQPKGCQQASTNSTATWLSSSATSHANDWDSPDFSQGYAVLAVFLLVSLTWWARVTASLLDEISAIHGCTHGTVAKVSVG